MNIYIMDPSLERVGVIDSYRSIIWTQRYYEPGDFELLVDATPENIDLCRRGRFLYRDMDYADGTLKSVMIIQFMQLHTSIEEGNTILLQGKDIKSLLNQRIILSQAVFSETLEANIRKAITENIISPSIAARAISNFTLAPEIGGTETIKAQVAGENLGTWISEQLKVYEIGYDVVVTNGNFVFSIYRGADRSYEQTVNPHVVFSPDYENLLGSDYMEDATEYANVAMIAGEGEGSSQKTATAGDASGLDRRELFVDAKSLSTDSESGTISSTTYKAQMITKGQESLAGHRVKVDFAGEIQPEVTFIYGVDYFLGDKVEIANEFGVESPARIVEIIDSEDETGRTVVPTFSSGGE